MGVPITHRPPEACCLGLPGEAEERGDFPSMAGWALGSLGLRGNNTALAFLGRVLGPLSRLRKGFLFLLEVTELVWGGAGAGPGPTSPV